MAAFAAVIILSGPTPADASSGGASAPGSEALATPSVAALLPSGGALAAMPLKPETLQSPAGGAIYGHTTVVRGQLSVHDSDRRVVLEYFNAKHGWERVATGRTNAIGAFRIALRPRHIGRFMFRATTARGATAATSTATPMTAIEVYRPVIATIFGPGDFGGRTACGQILTPQLLGVAHLTLPCGTPVDISYGSHMITVPVVDRGPYVGGVSYDLTSATASALGINDTAHIGALAIHSAAEATPAAP